MFKKNYNLLLLLLIIGGVLILAACGGETTESSASDSSETSGTEAEDDLPEGFPSKTVEVLVGYGAGGGTDLSARTMVEALNKHGIVEQSFIVENNEGAGGALTLREVANNKGDGHMLVAVPEFGEPLWNDTAQDIELSDFTPVAQVATDTQVVAVAPDSPYETITDLLDAIKEDPSSISMSLASAINGAEAWRWVEMAKQHGIEEKLNLVVTGGGNPALTALLSGDVDATFVVPQLAKDHLEEGNIKVLGIMTEKRTEMFPDIPTLIEQGIDVTYYRQRGFWINSDAPDSVVKFWESAFEEMVETDTWKEYTANAGLLNEFKGTKEYSELVENDGASYREFFEEYTE